MSAWIIRRNIPYEGLHEEWCESAEAVVKRLDSMSGLETDDVESIVPIIANSYDMWAFKEAFEKGEVV